MATLRRLLALALSISLLAPCAVASRAASVAKDSDSASSFKVVPKAYIVELESRVANLDGRSEENLRSRFHRRAQEQKLEYKIRREFVDDSLFHGLSIDIQRAEDVATIENLSEVKRVWPVIELPLPVPFDRTDSTGSITKRTPALPPKGPPKVIRSENSTMDFNLKATGVDQLHSHGYKGKGIKVAVIDSGIDYSHHALGGGFGPGKKVAFGRNYVESEGTPDDPIATCEQASHGTSTAGESAQTEHLHTPRPF
jgi:subtilisin family serine protease